MFYFKDQEDVVLARDLVDVWETQYWNCWGRASQVIDRALRGYLYTAGNIENALIGIDPSICRPFRRKKISSFNHLPTILAQVFKKSSLI
jgi:hypothetical protein